MFLGLQNGQDSKKKTPQYFRVENTEGSSFSKKRYPYQIENGSIFQQI